MRLVSGAEPGVAYATCLFAKTKEIEVMGHCHPTGKNRDGVDVASAFGLKPLGGVKTTLPFDFRAVTIHNVRLATYVLILHLGIEKQGHLLFRRDDRQTEGFHARLGRNIAFEQKIPYGELDIQKEESYLQFKSWLIQNRPERLCILGPSDEEARGASEIATFFWQNLFGGASSFHDLLSTPEARQVFDREHRAHHFVEVQTPPQPLPQPPPQPPPIQTLKQEDPVSTGKPREETRKPPELSYYKKLLVKAERRRRRVLEE